MCKNLNKTINKNLKEMGLFWKLFSLLNIFTFSGFIIWDLCFR
jgi:hypothetical protein